MQHAILQKYEEKFKKDGVPELEAGDTVKVHVRIKEGDKERIQIFEGDVIAINNTGLGKSVTVRKISFGQGVERIFPLNAPVVERFEIMRRNRVRRAKLYHLRGLRGKAARLKERSVNRG